MRQITIQQAFGLAAQHHQAGRLQEADELYRMILARHPAHSEAMHLLGILAYQQGRNCDAVELLRKAAALNPQSPQVHYNLGNALKESKKLEEAIAAYRRAVLLRPDYAAAYNNLGIVLNDTGQTEDSISAFRLAIALRPNHAQSHSNLGDALRTNRQLSEAIDAYRRAIALQPNYAEAHNNLGNVLRDAGQFDQAILSHRTALMLRPQSAEFHSNLGNALKDKGDTDAAIAAYQQAIALAPDYAEAHYNLANALKDRGQLDEAIASYRQAIALKPDYAQALSNLGNALADAGEIEPAIAAYRRVVALSPELPEPHSNLLYSMQFDPGCTSQAIAEEHHRWNLRHAEPLRPSITEHGNHPGTDRRLRVGYVSPNFWGHCQSLFMVPLLSAHDRQQVEVFCYADVRRPDAHTDQMRKHVDGWRDIVGQSDEDVAARIRQDQIDILVDLTMHMAHNRLLTFARKPAPIQVTWLAYPGSTGLGAIDYRLSDQYLDPHGRDESIYSEKTVRLPNSFWCYEPMEGREIADNPLPALESGVITFGCLNNFCKVNWGVLDLWAKVLQQVEGSRLLLLAKTGSHRQRTLDRLAQQGIDPRRIEFVSYLPRREYLELYQRIDVGLDTSPYNGHTTSLDSLWMGVPVVTLVGERAVSRAGWCQLSNLNLRELAAETDEQFVRIAVELCKDLPSLADLRSSMRQKMLSSPLMDAPAFARDIEAAYRKMWKAWCEKVSGKKSVI
jgi:predicted O-linked N-acetylglucosamine transferase (SPINDLY family)